MRRLRIAFLVFFAIVAVSQASETEPQTINKDISSSSGWVASFGTAPQQVRSDNGYLSIAGRGGAGQYFVVNGKSKYQIATATALKSSDWGAIGVTYYDANWNEVHVVRKEVTSDLRSGGEETRYAIGIVPPANAAYGFLWVWNDDVNGYTQVDNFELLNYFPDGNFSFDGSQPVGSQFTQTFPSDRNLLVNGNFETSQFEGDEFWNVTEIDNSVYYQTQGFLGGTTGLHVGSPDGVNMLSQITTELKGGKGYSIAFTGGRYPSAGSDTLWAIVGVDYFDQNWNKLGSESEAITRNLSVGKFATSNLKGWQLSAPVGTVNSVFWIWVEGGDSPLWIQRIDLIERDDEPPVIEYVDVDDVASRQSSWSFDVELSDNYRVNLGSRSDNDFTVVGPNGAEREVNFNSPNPFFYQPDYTIKGSFSSADNGTYTIYYTPGEIEDVFGNAADRPSPEADSQVVGSFEVNIGNN